MCFFISLGSLEVGKLADIVAVDLVGNDDLGHPIYDPVSHLVYTTHREVRELVEFQEMVH